ncbi:hypothetical protein OIU91_40835 (plasmid) [Streptomyces sp. NBC_01456]|uniref:hypothetical protein n=1 Tax=unclassified Streptomyces TaxID=2593676 RepID=UPI002E351EAE|nr:MULTISPECIES: hypothetical protein [unclassified Streptomyces]
MGIDRSRAADPRLDSPFALVLSRVHLPPAGWLLMLTMEPRTPAGELDDLTGLGWPLWDDVLQRDPRWVVSIDAGTRRIKQVVRLNDAQNAVEKNLFDLGAGIPVPDDWWPMVEGQRPVVLCGPLRGEPTDENLDIAKQAATLRGIATRTLIG